MRTFAIGDIHGHLSSLAALLARLRETAETGDALVFLGDYIDRGPDSRGVIETVIETRDAWDGPVTCLLGNHEDMLLTALAAPKDRERLYLWMLNGAVQTLRSYGWEGDSTAWPEAIPAEHLAFIRALSLWHEDERALYVHAGIPPGKAPEECSRQELLWDREPFLDSDEEREKVVVFGHTPQFEGDAPPRPGSDRWRPLNRPEKIGVDTGRGWGGPLTAVQLPEREFFSEP